MRKSLYLLSLALLVGCQGHIPLEHDITQKDLQRRLSKYYQEQNQNEQIVQERIPEYISLLENEREVLQVDECCPPNELLSLIEDYNSNISKSAAATAALDELVLKGIEEDPTHLLHNIVRGGKQIYRTIKEILRLRYGDWRIRGEISTNQIGIGIRKEF